VLRQTARPLVGEEHAGLAAEREPAAYPRDEIVREVASGRGTTPPTAAIDANPPPRYRAIASTESERTSGVSRPSRVSTQMSESTFSRCGCRSRTARPATPSRAANRADFTWSWRRMNCTLREQKAQSPS
jgi:hypothetical protein